MINYYLSNAFFQSDKRENTYCLLLKLYSKKIHRILQTMPFATTTSDIKSNSHSPLKAQQYSKRKYPVQSKQ